MERNLGVLVDSKLNMGEQRALADRWANHALGYIKHGIASWSREAIVPHHSAPVRPDLEYCVQFGAPQYKKGIELLEVVQRRVTKMVMCLEGRMHEVWLRLFGLFSLGKRKQKRPHGSL